MTQQVDSKHDYFNYLDVIRFVAAFLIVIAHSYEAFVGWFGNIGFMTIGDYKTLTPIGEFMEQIIWKLNVGVDIFFLLSGFLITHILLKEKEVYGKIHIGYFILRRTFRIWPLYFFLIALSPWLVEWAGRPDPDYWANALFLGNFNTINTQDWQYPFAHFWSICVEEHFYLVWPFLIQWVPKKRLPILFGIMIAISIAFRLYAHGWMENTELVLYLHTISRMDILVLGALGAYFYTNKPISFALKPWLRMAIWAGIILFMGFNPFGKVDGFFEAAFSKYILVGLVTLLMLNYNFNKNYKHTLKPKSIFHYFGRVSYGIYMYHNVLLILVVKYLMWPLKSGNMYLFFGTVFTLSIVLPILSYELMEKHFLKLNKRFRLIQSRKK